MSDAQLRQLADRLSLAIERTQQRNAAARMSARRRRLRVLANLGIDPDKLILCDQCSL